MILRMKQKDPQRMLSSIISVPGLASTTIYGGHHNLNLLEYSGMIIHKQHHSKSLLDMKILL